LVVDDDDDIRQALVWLLTDEGHDAVPAVDGKQALELLRATTKRWLVLLDLRLPVLDGESLLHIVVSDPVLAQQHAYVGMTASADKLTATLADLQGQLDVPMLGKPFELDTLLAAVTQAAARLERG
jgi:CheY-like chemotaxis protein